MTPYKATRETAQKAMDALIIAYVGDDLATDNQRRDHLKRVEAIRRVIG